MKRILSIFLLTLFLLSLGAGIALAFSPSSEIIPGLDVSIYQQSIDFRQVRAAGFQMVYIRSSLGYSYVDPNFERNADGAEAAGLEYGFYHFCTASTEEEAVQQARFFADLTRSYEYDLKLVLELSPSRELSRTETTDVALAFLEELQRRTGEDAAIYCSASTARDKYDSRLSGYALWVADYGVESPEPNDNWETWAGFQYSDSGRVNGIRGRVDLDHFTAQMRVQCEPSPTASPLPTVSPVPTATSAPTATATPCPTPSSEERCYVVQPGDTLGAIAERFGVSVDYLVEENGISDPSVIWAGQILRY